MVLGYSLVGWSVRTLGAEGASQPQVVELERSESSTPWGGSPRGGQTRRHDDTTGGDDDEATA